MQPSCFQGVLRKTWLGLALLLFCIPAFTMAQEPAPLATAPVATESVQPSATTEAEPTKVEAKPSPEETKPAPEQKSAEPSEPVKSKTLASLKDGGSGSTMMQRLQSLIGLFGLLLIAYLLSVNRPAVDMRVVVWGTALQFIFGVLVLKTAPGLWLFDQLNVLVTALLGFTDQGSKFIFGDNYTEHFFAFKVLPTIIFFSSFMALMYHMGLMQGIVNFMSKIMQSTMRTSGSETLSASANIFVGQTEAPLVVKPYIEKMTKSELMAVMTGGFATVAGGVMAAYVGMLQNYFPDIAGHLIAASVMSAPAALVLAKIMQPETEESMTRGGVKMSVEKIDVNAIDAAARGASEGLTLALNVGAMLLAFIALIAMFNALLGFFGGWIGFPSLNLQTILGYIFWPVAWLMGISPTDCMAAGQLLGIKTVLNEFVAYLDLANMMQAGSEISGRTVIILTYALCGFANFSSIAIQIGGIGSIAPSRRHDLAKLGMRAMIAGTIASFMTAAIAGILI